MAISQAFTGSNRIFNSDSLAANLRLALPGSFSTGFDDLSYLIRGNGSPAIITNNSNRITTTSATSRFYGSSLELWREASSTAGTVELDTNTGSGTQIGTGDFCIEAWIRVENFSFNTAAQIILQYPLSDSNASLTEYVTPYIMITGDNWPDVPNRRGIIHYNPTGATLITQTPGSLFTTSTWHHIAVTRASNTARIFIDGVLRAAATSTVNYTGFRYKFLVASRSFTTGVNYQDVRLYVGQAKYTTSFTPSSTPMFSLL